MSIRNLAVRQNPFARLDPWALLTLGLPLLLTLAAWGWGHHVWHYLLAYAGGVPSFGLPPATWNSLAPLLAMINPLLTVAATVAAQKDGLLTRGSAYAAMLGAAIALLLTLSPEAQRLAVYRGSLPPVSILRMADTPYLLSFPLTLVAIAAAWCLLSPEAKATPVPVKRAASQNFGTSDWLTMTEAQERFPGPDPVYGGIVIGETYRVDQDRTVRQPDGTLRPFDPRDKTTWGLGGTKPLLIDACRTGSTHGLVVAGSGAFKTTGIAIPTLLSWTGSAVVLDPSREIGPMMTAAREAMGHRVLTLDPTQPEAGAINVLDVIDPDAPLAEAAVENVVLWLCGEPASEQTSSGAGAVFQDFSKAMVGAVLADIVWDTDLNPEERTLRRVRQVLVTPETEMRAVLQRIHENSRSSLAQELAGTLMNLADVTFSGAYGNATRDTKWLSVPSYAALVSGNSVRTRELCAGRLTIFVQIPLRVLKATPALGRVLVGALLDAVYSAEGQTEGRVLFLLDEVAQLKKMQLLETARDAGRKYAITMVLLYQSIGQIAEHWGPEGKTSWYASTTWRMFGGVQDLETAREVSELCGTFGAEAMSQGTTRGTSGRVGDGTSVSTGQSKTHSEINRPLITPAEILQTVRADESFLFMLGAKPLRCGRAIFFRRPEMVERVEASRFHRPEPAHSLTAGHQRRP